MKVPESRQLDDMNLIGVRRAVIVDECPVVEPNRVDDQLVTFIMPH
jgi:hypothetical protein